MVPCHGHASGGEGSNNDQPGSSKQRLVSYGPRESFDLVLSESSFPRANPPPDDTNLVEELLKRDAQLTPTQHERATLIDLMNKIRNILHNLVPPHQNELLGVSKYHAVGSFRTDIMITGHNVADIVVILNTVPSKEAITKLAFKIRDDLNTISKFDYIISIKEHRGILINNGAAYVRLAISTTRKNIRKFRRGSYLDKRTMNSYLAAINHVHWFEENVKYCCIKILIRIWRDLSARFEGFGPLNPWMVHLFVHHAVMKNPSNKPLQINQAFRRTFQILAAGIFLPGSTGIADPFKGEYNPIHRCMTYEQQDLCCRTAQTLLRILSHGGYKFILGTEGNIHFKHQIYVYNDVVLLPQNRVYQRADKNKKGKRNTGPGRKGNGNADKINKSTAK